MEELGSGQDTEWRDHLIVCGLSGLAVRLIVALHRSGTDVVVVDENPDPVRRQLIEDHGVPLTIGAPRLPTVLARAGAARARALICVDDRDLATLETALSAHNHWPHLRIVARIANPSVARALTEVTGPGTVLDVATLAAPSLIEACLAEPHQTMNLEGAVFEATRAAVGQPATLRVLFGDLVPIAVVRQGSSEVEVCPGRDVHVGPGDQVVVLGSPDDLRTMGLGRIERQNHPGVQRVGGAGRAGAARAAVARVEQTRDDAPRAGPVGQAAILARSMWAQVDRGFRYTFLGLVLLAVIATVILRLGYVDGSAGSHHHLTVLSSLYFTVETIATVGYGDFSFGGQSAWLQVTAIIIIILGVSSLTTLFALLTNQLLGRSLANALGQRRITGMRGHVVVVGLGAIGVRVAEGLLAAGRGVVVIETDDGNRHLARARALGLPIITGDASEASTLDAANTAAASAVAVLTSDDLTNLDVGLVLRDYLGAAGEGVPTVLRIFDRALSDTLASTFGFRSVRSTSALAAPWFIGAALGLDILSTFYVERELFLVGRLTVATDGGLSGLSMQELSARIRVIAIRRAGAGEVLEYPPRRSTRFAPGDRAYLIGPPEELLFLLRRDAQASIAPASVEGGT